MENNKSKRKSMAVPIEKHDTAAWANMESKIQASNINLPNEIQVRNAKEYVDTNEK